MLTKTRHLRHLSDWCTKHCEPIIAALTREDIADAWAGLAKARAALDESELSADDHHSLSLHLGFLEFLVQYNLADHGKVNIVTWQDMLTRLKSEPKGQGSKFVRNWIYLAVRLLGDTAGFMELTEAELSDLFQKVPAEDRDSGLWHYIATWAVEHRNQHYIKLAYHEMQNEPSNYLRYSIWNKLNLVHLLMEGKAKQRDVLDTIKVLKHPNQMRRFDAVIWPMIAERKLDTDELRHAVETKRSELQCTPMEAPRY